MNAIKWMAGAVVVLGLGALIVVISMNLMPARATVVGPAAAKLVPWYFTWGLVWAAVLTALVVAASLVATGMSELRGSQDTRR